MPRLPLLRLWLRSLFQRARLDAELKEEMRFHLETEVERLCAEGLSPAEARRAAQRQFGGLAQMEEHCRDQWSFVWLELLARDFRLARRSLAKSPGFTSVAIFTLALGLGSTTAYFSVFRALLLDPLPYRNPGQLVHIWSSYAASFVNGQPVSAPDYLDIRAQYRSYAEIGAYALQRFNLGGDQPEAAVGGVCTAGVFRAFGIRPALGRWFHDEDEAVGAPPVALLSHALWQRSFGGDPQIVGRSVRLNGQATTVVGIMPAGFEFQSPRFRRDEIELWTPVSLTENKRRGHHWLIVLARLREGVSVETADAEAKAIGARLNQAYPGTNQHKPFVVRPLLTEITQTAAPGLWILLAAVALVLLVSCANVAGMLLARGCRRVAEFGVRLALGATRGNLLRLLLTESLLLGLFGCVTGSLFAIGIVEFLRRIIAVPEARRAAIQIDPVMLLVAVALAVVASAVAGLIPALAATRTPVNAALKVCGGAAGTATRSRHRFLRHLVGAQISVALVLANSAVILTAAYLKVFDDNRRHDTANILTGEVTLLGERYATIEARMQFWEQYHERARALPGVEAVGITVSLPFEGGGRTDFLVDDEPYDPAIVRPLAQRSFVSPGYFAAMGLRLQEGRMPEPDDALGAVTRIVINRTMADLFWSGRSAVGRRIRSNDAVAYFSTEVVGVVEDLRQRNPETPPMPEIFLPLRHSRDYRGGFLIVGAERDAHGLASALRAQLAAIDPDLTLSGVRTMNEIIRDNTRGRHFLTLLTNVFMATALLLAAVGIYGTLSYQLSYRTREIGLRMALGAGRSDVLGLVFRQTLPWALGGGAAGLVLSLAAAWAFRAMIPGISPFNPLYFGAGATLVAAAVLLACWLPARRATRIDPMRTLRAE